MIDPSKHAALKADIAANTSAVQAGQPDAGGFVGTQIKDIPNTQDGNQCIASWYNLAHATWFAWLTSYSAAQIKAAIITTNGAANQLDALTGSKRDSLLWLVDSTLNMALSAVQSSIDDLCGSQNTLKGAIKDGGKRKSTNYEKLDSIGTGTFASPATLGYEGAISKDDVEAARNS